MALKSNIKYLKMILLINYYYCSVKAHKKLLFCTQDIGGHSILIGDNAYHKDCFFLVAMINNSSLK